MKIESNNYLKHRTICPITQDCLKRNEVFVESTSALLKQKIIQNTVIGNELSVENESSLEKKQAIGQFVTVLQKIVLQQQKQQRELLSMLRNRSMVTENVSFSNDVTVQSQGIKKEVKKEDSAEEKLKKAEQRVQELETLLKKMELEKKQSEPVATQSEKIVSTKDKEEKKSELWNKVLKSTQGITIDPLIQRQNQSKIAALRNPDITTKGILYKKISVTWNTIYFGCYPSKRLSDTWLKNQLEKYPNLDDSGNYVYGTGKNARVFRRNIRDFYEYQPICWRVLDIKNGVATLFADQILDVKPYHEIKDATKVTWEKSSLRQWLNKDSEGSFYHLAFSEEEKAAILDKTVRQDKVTLLRHIEILDKTYQSYGFYDMYKGNNISYIEGLNPNSYTDYAGGKSISRKETSDGRKGAWWLKDTVANGTRAIEVKCQGFIDVVGTNMNANGVGVRPVIVVDLKKLNEVIEVGNSVEVIRV